MIDDGHCSSSVSYGDRDDFKSEIKDCVTVEESVTPVTQLAEQIFKLSRPNVSLHLVKKVDNKVCFSQQKLTLMPKRRHSDDVIVRPQVIGFSCVDSPSDVAASLERRANQGEDLQVELRKLPIDFTSIEYEPEYV